MRRRLLVAGLVALAAPLAGAAAQPSPAPARADWSHVIVRTAEGGFRMGNPDARVKLVQYSSITCGHCGNFVIDGAEALASTYIDGGGVSWEYRPFVIFPSDPAIFQLLVCGGAENFFPRAAHLYAIQPEWTERLDALPEGEAAALDALRYDDPRAHGAAILRASQVDRFFREAGMSDADIAACLADETISGQLEESTGRGSDRDGVTGTPFFLINGVAQQAHDWRGLEPALRAELGLE